MVRGLALSGSVAASAAADYTFAQFKLDHGKTYESVAEEAKRLAIFEATKREIEAHNKDAAQTWTKAVNQFSDMTPAEFRGSHGWVNSAGLDQHGIVSFTESAFEIPSDFKLSDLPKTVDWRAKGVVSAVKNQGMVRLWRALAVAVRARHLPAAGTVLSIHPRAQSPLPPSYSRTPPPQSDQCGSCWAFSSTENVESHVALNAKLSVAPVLSPQNLVSCDPNPKHCGGKGGCLGSVPELAFDYVQEFGLASEADWPYVSGHTSVNEACNNSAAPAAHITGYTKLQANNYTEVMYTLANVGPVAVNVDAIPMQVSVLLCTVTFYANLAHSLTRSP
jgi:cathepsin L